MIRREAIAGIILGLMLGVVVTFWAYFLQGSVEVALTVGVSLVAISVLASTAGGTLPILFRRVLALILLLIVSAAFMVERLSAVLDLLVEGLLF